MRAKFLNLWSNNDFDNLTNLLVQNLEPLGQEKF